MKDTPIYKVEGRPTLILAGPGTGKTHSMALRVKWLIQEKGIDPQAITVMTFTAEAALNMRHRLSDEEKPDVFVPREQQPNQISTMHSLGLQIISNNFRSLNLDEAFRVLDSDQLRRLLFEDSSQLAGLLRNQGLEAHLLKAQGRRLGKEHQLWRTTQYYNSILRSGNFIDFDDQILLACDLLTDSPTLLTEYQNRAVHLLIDEYQDINYAQFELIKLLSSKSASGLFAVGDDDQSIYSFWGGSPNFIRSFEKHFGKKAGVLEISRCRRCPPKVLHGALSIVSQFNQSRLEKVEPSFSSNNETPIQIVSSPSAEREAYFIAEKCSRVTPSHDVLIYSSSSQFRKANSICSSA